MPIDINLLRPDRGGNPETVKESQRRRNASVELVDTVMALDAEAKAGLSLAFLHFSYYISHSYTFYFIIFSHSYHIIS